MAAWSRIGTAGCLAVLAAFLMAADSAAALRPYVQGSLAAAPEEIEPQWWGELAVAAVVAATVPAVAHYGARLATLAALAMLVLAYALCGLAPSAGWYLVCRHLQFALTAVALVALASWVLPGFDPRRWGLVLAAFDLVVLPVVSTAAVLAQFYGLDTFSWRAVMHAAAACIAVAAVAAIWLPGPPSAAPAIAGVFGTEPSPTEVGRRGGWLAAIVAAGGFTMAILLTRLVDEIVSVDPPTIEAKMWLKLLLLSGQALAIVAVAILALRFRPGWIGAVCCGLLFLGCVTLATGTVDLDHLDPLTIRAGALAIAVAAQLAFVLAALQANRRRLAVSAGLVVTAVPLAWGIWDLMVRVKLIDEPIQRDRFIAMGLAALAMVAGVVGRDDD